MKSINININDQKVSTSKVITVNGTVKLIECLFDFNEHWSNFPAKTAVFKNNNMVNSYEVVISNNRCIVPHEALSKAGIIRMAVKGSNTDNQTERTETVDVICQNKTLQGGINAIDPTPDQYAQYVEEVGGAISEYFDEHKSEFKGDPGEPGEAGVSPTATVTPIQGGAKITVTDAEGTTEATIMNGEKGDDGISPTATVRKNGNKSTLTVEDKNGSTSVEILDGAKGDPGDSYVITEADYQAIGDKVEAEYTPELTNVRESLSEKADKTELDETSAKLDALWKLNQGQTYDVYESTSEDYSKSIPSGAYWGSLDMVGGKSVVWNQLADLNAIDSATNCTTTYVDGVLTIKPNNTNIAQAETLRRATYKAGHKLYARCDCKSSAWGSQAVTMIYAGYWFTEAKADTTKTDWQTCNTIVSYPNSNTGNELQFRKYYEETNAPLYIKNAIVIDLTQMFGSGNEPTSVNDPRIKAIEEYALAHPQYNDGEIISSQTDEVVVRGKNLWNEEWEIGGLDVDTGEEVANTDRIRANGYIVCEPNTRYYYAKPNESGNLQFVFYDKNKSFVGNYSFSTTHTFVTPPNAYFMRFNSGGAYGTIYKNDIVIIKGTSGNYAPYVEPVTHVTNFPVLRSAGNVYDYIDLNRGELHRRIGVVDLGTLYWNYNPSYSGAPALYCNNYPQFKPYIGYSDAPKPNVLMADYDTVTYIDFRATADACLSVTGSTCFSIRDSRYTDGNTFKSAMNGVMLYYELATEIIEPITIPTDLTEWLEVEPNGSITFINHDDYKLLIPNTERFVRKLNEV